MRLWLAKQSEKGLTFVLACVQKLKSFLEYVRNEVNSLKTYGGEFFMRSQMVLSILCRNHQLLEFQSKSSVLAPVTLQYMVLRKGVNLEAFFQFSNISY